MNERALAKWESATASSFEKFKEFAGLGAGGLGIMLERIILALDEMRAWAQWSVSSSGHYETSRQLIKRMFWQRPEKFAVFELEANVLRKSVTLIAEILKRVTQVEKFILEQESSFASFSRWVRYGTSTLSHSLPAYPINLGCIIAEIEKINMPEGADTRPTARFQPLPVSQYILNSLASSPITPFLDFGLGTTSLEQNLVVAQVERWFDSKIDGSSSGSGEGNGMGLKEEESLFAVMRRMKEELRGQADAALLSTSTSTTALPPSAERPKRVDIPTNDDEESIRANTSFGTTSLGQKLDVDSIPVLLHVLAGRLAGTFQLSLEKLGRGIVVREGVELGKWLGDEVEEVTVRERLVDGMLCYAWVDGLNRSSFHPQFLPVRY